MSHQQQRKAMSQRQILECASKHKTNPAVNTLLASITEAQMLAKAARSQIQAFLDVAQEALKFESHDFSVTLYHGEFVTAAHIMAATMTRIGHDIMTLASILQQLGEDIIY